MHTICLEVRTAIVQDPYRPQTAREKQWEDLDHCRRHLHSQAETERYSVFFPAFLQRVSGMSLIAPRIMCLFDEISPVVISIKGLSSQTSDVKVI